ncbi:mechanosensitive ion channel domain-containing protein [Halobellus sp. GM3]|uniref:mechanosensitive ion channel domain-containing protein n=1 Tax=Halobellus sp. GM3 TaxID=3458410 RepID=UPI00403E23B2
MPPGQVIPPGTFEGVVADAYRDLFRTAAGFALSALVVYVLGRALVLPVAIRIIAERNRNNPTLQTAAETYLHAAIVFVALLIGIVGAGLWRFLSNLTIIVAALTLVVGAASQGFIGSLVSGLSLIADPDFNVGDWIAWPDGEGIVEAVDFRVTRIRTVNNETITVPNTELTASTLRRPYGGERYRIVESVTISYDDDVELVLRELVEVARNDDRTLEVPEPTATLDGFEEAAIRVRAECWIADPMDLNLPALRSDFRRRVKRRLDGVGVTLGPASEYELSGGISVDLDGRVDERTSEPTEEGTD